MKEKTFQNILVIMLRKIGDAVIATAGIDLLKKAYPEAKITALVKPLTKDILLNHPLVDDVLLYNYAHEDKWRDLQSTVRMIRAKRFDLCVVLDNKPRSALLAWLARVPRRAGFEKIEFRNLYLKLFYTDLIPIDYDSLQVQQVRNHEIFLHRLTGVKEKAHMVMPDVSEESRRKIWKMLEDLPKGKKRIALCIRSGCLTKDWPVRYFQQVVRELNAHCEAAFCIIGSAADVPFAEAFIKDIGGGMIKNFCGQTTLPELGYLLKQMDLFLSVDTGSAHICGAVGTPLVVVFGSTSPRRWGPYAENAIYFAPKTACHPCDSTKKKCSRPVCLDSIMPQEVFEACMELLNQTTGGKGIENHRIR